MYYVASADGTSIGPHVAAGHRRIQEEQHYNDKILASWQHDEKLHFQGEMHQGQGHWDLLQVRPIP